MQYMEPHSGPWTADEAAHLCRRAGFGGRPDDVASMVEMGLERAVSSLVDYEPVDAELEAQIESLRDFDDFQAIKDPADFLSLQAWWLYRMAHTRQPLQEQFALFLHDHFVSDWDKARQAVPGRVNDGNDGSDPDNQQCTGGSLPPDPGRRDRVAARLLRDQNELFRRRGHGPFEELLRAVTRDPAMLIYLDNWKNDKTKPQENYARELMELFSMGIGNYTEEDVREVARALTGETLKTACHLDYAFTHYVHPGLHDRLPKRVFGTRFNEGSRGQDTDKVIELVMNRVSGSGITPAHNRLPATAIYMSWKYITWFVREDIPIEHPAVAELAELYYARRPNGYNYDTREALRTLFLSSFFYDPAHRFQMIKHPADFVVSALRCLELDETGYDGAARFMASMGMELFAPPTVDGWIHGRAWINSANLIARFNYADRLSRRTILRRTAAQRMLDGGAVSGEDDDEGIIEYLRTRLIQQPLNDREMDILLTFQRRLRYGEDKFRRKVNGVAHLMMTMPKYQVK